MSCSHYSCISQQAKRINIAVKTKNQGIIQYLPINSMVQKSTVKANEKSKSMALMVKCCLTAQTATPEKQ
ncbi:hypothetical protein [Candidatus Enterovibrio altilux]|uniref:Mobile element protein n=1 Tax=Candidatus Enterovibrio altilux TaxID=1927128 RepID=A0A291BBK4_9GAMM|nr:Mobile element protein [Candidatus Enterovibrio luxaltus]